MTAFPWVERLFWLMSIIQFIHFLFISNEITAPWRKQRKQKWFNSILALRSAGKDNSCRPFPPTCTISTQSAPFSLAHMPGGLLLLTSVDRMLCRFLYAQSTLTWNFVLHRSCRMLLGKWGASALPTSPGCLAVRELLYTRQPETKPCPNPSWIRWDTSTAAHDSILLCPEE